MSYLRFLDDFPAFPQTNVWTDIGGIQSRSDPKVYVVQTCLLYTSDAADERSSVDLGGRRIITKKKKTKKKRKQRSLALDETEAVKALKTSKYREQLEREATDEERDE